MFRKNDKDKFYNWKPPCGVNWGGFFDSEVMYYITIPLLFLFIVVVIVVLNLLGITNIDILKFLPF